LERDLYELETFLKICRVALFKNLLIVIAAERVLVHDLKSKANKCYIPIQQGELAFVSEDYYSLKLAYFLDTHVIVSREFWLNKQTHVEGLTFNLAAYSPDASRMALVLKNVLSIYHGALLEIVYGFSSNVQQLLALGDYFFVKLEDGAILGCNSQHQVNFLEHEDTPLDFWNRDYDSVLVGGRETLFEVCKGVVRKYRLDRAQPCSLSDSKSMIKSSSSLSEE
jgi:hypothetical protein